MATFFPTSTPVAEEAAVASYGELTSFWKDGHAEITNLKQQVATLDNLREHWQRQYNEAQQKIENVKGYFFDLYSENGEIEDEIKYIAELLDIVLMKQIAGTAKYEINWTAQVPLDFDADDFEISFDVNCETYEAEDFDYNEDNTEVCGEDV